MRNASQAQHRDTLECVIECLDKERCEIFPDCITLVHLKFEDYFMNRVQQLTFTFSEDALTSSGTQFWSTPRHVSCPLQFAVADLNSVNFVWEASALRAEIWLATYPGELQKPSAKSLCRFVAGEIVVRLGNLHCTFVGTPVHKLSARQGWTPAPVQLQILECILCHGIRTRSKQKIKEVAKEVTPHGQISETKVYDWFQVETDAESPNEKKSKPENFQLQHNSAPGGEDMWPQDQETSSEMHSVDPPPIEVEPAFPSNHVSKTFLSFSQLSFYDSMRQNSRMDHLIGKLEVPGSYDPYQHDSNLPCF